MMRYEFKKIIYSKFNILVILIGILTTILIPTIKYFTLERNFEKHNLDGLKAVLDDKLSEKYEQEYEALNSLIFPKDSKGVIGYDEKVAKERGTYKSTKIEDFAVLGSIVNIFDKIQDRQERIKDIVRDSKTKSDFSLISYFDKQEELMICDTFMMGNIVNNLYFPIISCVVVIIVCGNFFVTETKNRQALIMTSTQKGYTGVVFCKIICGIIVSCCVCTINMLSYMCFIKFGYGVTRYELIAPLWYVEEFMLAGTSITLLHYIIITYLLSLIVAISFSLISMFISQFNVKRHIGTFVVGFLAIALYVVEIMGNRAFIRGFETVDKNIVSYYTFSRVYAALKQFNPFAIIDLKYYYLEPRFFEIKNYTMQLWIIPVVFCQIINIGSAILIFISNKFPKKELV